ncbi:hypothetical protein B0T17DRAFT_530132 [Bombardia bombarda]|uniref:Uncharacterized protein n=1 Tax=Bombardia bombarda TaxID=252184 RepID=A0AA39XCC0_9PEZI|nr:hypothetical protein B0T17DRAFT_530132 [Bombardia bombarda]
MERDQAVFDNLLDRENKLVADILSGFRGLVLHGVAKAGDRSSTGQAAYNAMAVEILMNGMVTHPITNAITYVRF